MLQANDSLQFDQNLMPLAYFLRELQKYKEPTYFLKYSQELLDWYNNKYLNFLTSKELIAKVKENSGVDFNQIDNGELAISLLAKGAIALTIS